MALRTIFPSWSACLTGDGQLDRGGVLALEAHSHTAVSVRIGRTN